MRREFGPAGALIKDRSAPRHVYNNLMQILRHGWWQSLLLFTAVTHGSRNVGAMPTATGAPAVASSTLRAPRPSATAPSANAAVPGAGGRVAAPVPTTKPQPVCWRVGEPIFAVPPTATAWPSLVSAGGNRAGTTNGYPQAYRWIADDLRSKRSAELAQAYPPLTFGMDRFGFVSSVSMPSGLCDASSATAQAVAAANAAQKAFVVELQRVLPGVLIGEFHVAESTATRTIVTFGYVSDYLPNYALGPKQVEQPDARLLATFSKQRIALVQSTRREQIIQDKRDANACAHAGNHPCDPPGPRRRQWMETKTWVSAAISAKSVSGLRRFDAAYLTKTGIEIRRVVEPQWNDAFFDELAKQRKIPDDVSYDFVIRGARYRDAVTGEILDGARLRTDWRTL